jgi:hypothetical protein
LPERENNSSKEASLMLKGRLPTNSLVFIDLIFHSQFGHHLAGNKKALRGTSHLKKFCHYDSLLENLLSPLVIFQRFRKIC